MASPSLRSVRALLTWLPLCAGLLAPLPVLAAGFSQQPTSSAPPAAAPITPGIVQFPALDADGQTLVFTWLGDLWIAALPANLSGSSVEVIAQRATTHPADERRGLFSPHGKSLAFESAREGGRNLFIMPIAAVGQGADREFVSGPVRAVTRGDDAVALSAWWPDGQSLVFTAASEGIFRGSNIFRVPVSGGPASQITKAFASSARPTPDGSALAFLRRRPEYTRPKYLGTATSDLWLITPGSEGKPDFFAQVTDHPASDGDAFPQVDGSIIFTSSRSGNFNLFRAVRTEPSGMTPAAWTITQLTNFAPAADEITIGHGLRDVHVSADGSRAVFVLWDKLLVLDLKTPNAQPVAITPRCIIDQQEEAQQRITLGRDVSEHAISPDGKTVAVVSRGEILLRSTDENRPTRRLTSSAAREGDIAWSPDGRVLWFTSDESGTSQLYYATVTFSREDLDKKPDSKAPSKDAAKEPTKEAEPAAEPASESKSEPKPDAKPEDADKPAEPAAARPARGERKPATPDFGKRWSEALRFEIKKFDTAIIPAASNIQLSGEMLGQEVRSPVPSPDGRKLLVTRGLGDLVLIDLIDRTARVLVNSWNQVEAQWAADSQHIVMAYDDLDFNSDVHLLNTALKADGNPHTPINLTRHPDLDVSPRLSRDGKVLYFLSDRGDENFTFGLYTIRLDQALEGLPSYELEKYFKDQTTATRSLKPVAAVLFDDPSWIEKDKAARNPKPAEKPADKSADKPAQPEADKPTDKPADPEADQPAAEPAEPKPAEPKAEPKLENKPDAPKPETPAPKPTPPARPTPPKPLEFKNLDSAYLRAQRITTGQGSVGNLVISPSGERIVFSAGPETPGPEAVGSLVSISFKGDDRKSVATGAFRNVLTNLSGDRVSFIRTQASSGSAAAAPILGGKLDTYSVSAVADISLQAQSRQKFLEAARIMGNGFYHDSLKNLPWRKLVDRYLPLAEKARTPGEFNRIFSLVLGELDGSHTGISGGSDLIPFTAPSMAVGALGLDADPTPEGWKITKLIFDGPASRLADPLQVGDVILAIDDRPAAGVPLHELLMQSAGRETLIKISRAASPAPAQPPAADVKDPAPPAGPTTRELLITPISAGAERNLRYNQEVLDRRAMVDKLSGGRLGYLHIRAMGEPSVRDFERDLFAAAQGKDALIIDVRDNGGGSTADILLSSLTAPRHTYTVPRGADPATTPKDAYPRDRRLIQGYTRPIVVLINENSFSNAEIFAHAIKTIGRGKLIGTATYGGVISTGAASLIDGTSIRTPFRGWYLPDGTDLENNGAKPDIDVPQLPADESEGLDKQLEAAVKALLP